MAANGTKIYPQGGSFTLSWADLPKVEGVWQTQQIPIPESTPPTVVRPIDTGISKVTFEPDHYTIYNADGSVHETYNYKVAYIFFFVSTDPSVKFVIMTNIKTLGYSVLAEDGTDLSGYTFAFDHYYPMTNGITITSPSGKKSVVKRLDSINAWKPCFLTGTLILTPTGHVAVEDIKLGMKVLTFDKDGHSVVKTVQYVGKNTVNRFHRDFELEKSTCSH